MISEEEFDVFQGQLVELGQKNFQLKEQLDELVAVDSELAKLKGEHEACEGDREEMRARHAPNVQRRASAQADAASRRLSTARNQDRC